MAAKLGLGVWLSGLLCMLGAAGCGGSVKNAGAGAGGDAGGGSGGSAEPPPEMAGSTHEDPAPQRLGWSIRDATPYSRTEHATVLDEARDRLIVIGGAGGLDVWALPLSGPSQNRWLQILPDGDSPPADESNVGAPVSAVYDPLGRRVLVLSADSYAANAPRIWELTLDDAPAWHELELEGPNPGAELDQGRMVVDTGGKRVLVVGGGLHSSGTWALSLEGAARWSRVADAPAQYTFTRSPFPIGINTGALFIDSARARAMLITAGVRDAAQVWAMPLAGGDWVLQSSNSCGADYDTTSTYDSAHDRVVFVGSDCGISTYSLANGQWQTSSMVSEILVAFSSIDDPQRARALFFSGGLRAGNATTALRYDDLSLSVLVPNSLGVAPGGSNGVWDERREALISFGDTGSDGGAPTRLHGSGPSDRWLEIASSVSPFNMAVYDTNGQAVVTVGQVDPTAKTESVARLSSAPGSDWEIIPTTGAPELRSWPVAVYDSVRQRLVLHGGEAGEASYPSGRYLDDTWALSLAGAAQWTELATSGDSGGGRSLQTAIFDPIGQRLISYGGSVDAIASNGPGDLHQLTLDDSLVWNELHAAGTGPAHAERVLTVYDPRGQRMLALDRTHLFALSLTGEPTWHRFCEPGMGMPGSLPFSVIGNGPSNTLLGLAPDGLFVALGDGTFRFDLDTGYCD